jgi:hypothetical protein
MPGSMLANALFDMPSALDPCADFLSTLCTHFQAAQQREQVQQQQLRQQHPPIMQAPQIGQGSPQHVAPATAGAYGVGVGGIPVTQQQLDAASLGSSSSTIMSFPAHPGHQQMQLQPATEQAFLQRQEQLRATDHGGFGAPLPAAHTEARTGVAPSSASGAYASLAAMQMAAPGSGVRGLPPSSLAPSTMGLSHFAEPSAAAAGMAPMPSLSFLNSGDLLGSTSGSMHIPLDFTMTQVPLAAWVSLGLLMLQS